MLAPIITVPEVTVISTARPLEDVYRSQQGGVFRIQASTCDGSGVGSGFLVSADELLTAAHVVAGTVSLIADEGSEVDPVTGTVEGADEELDIALVKLSRPVSGYVFSLVDATPATGASVAAIGFPLNQPKTLTVGTVSGVERTITLENGRTLTHLVQTDVALNPGNSGGPLLDRSGQVVGIVSAGAQDAQGLNFAASASLARPLVHTWQATPQAPAGAECDTPLGPQADTPTVSGPPSTDALTTAIVATIDAYINAINTGDYETARMRQAPPRRPSAQKWVDGLSSTYDLDVVVHSVTQTSGGADAWVSFTSLQDAARGPRPGETCTNWSIDYELIPADDGLWWINHGKGHAGVPISQPCA